MNGKGSKPRPMKKSAYDANYDVIRWKSKRPACADFTQSALVRNKRGIPLWVWCDGTTTMVGTFKDVYMPETSMRGQKMTWDVDDIVLADINT